MFEVFGAFFRTEPKSQLEETRISSSGTEPKTFKSKEMLHSKTGKIFSTDFYQFSLVFCFLYTKNRRGIGYTNISKKEKKREGTQSF